MNSCIYSIGYSGFSIKEFVETLLMHGITVIIDVRSTPFSRTYINYNKDVLVRTLKKNGILYRNYADEFGARQEDKNCLTAEGYLDFEKFAESKPFLDGIKKIRDGIKLDYVFALMCSEKNPVNCHRAILVSRAFAQMGCEVIHLLPGGSTYTQKDIEVKLLDMYFPERLQLSQSGELEDEEELIDEAYRRQNAVICQRDLSYSFKN